MTQMTQIAQIQKRSRGRPKAGLETERRDLKKESMGDKLMDSFSRSLHSVCGASRRPRTLLLCVAAGES
jgi:hypothetical protein